MWTQLAQISCELAVVAVGGPRSTGTSTLSAERLDRGVGAKNYGEQRGHRRVPPRWMPLG